jgi:hypothetical protein
MHNSRTLSTRTQENSAAANCARHTVLTAADATVTITPSTAHATLAVIACQRKHSQQTAERCDALATPKVKDAMEHERIIETKASGTQQRQASRYSCFAASAVRTPSHATMLAYQMQKPATPAAGAAAACCCLLAAAGACCQPLLLVACPSPTKKNAT